MRGGKPNAMEMIALRYPWNTHDEIVKYQADYFEKFEGRPIVPDLITALNQAAAASVLSGIALDELLAQLSEPGGASAESGS
jgi:hypothetical protein